MSERAGVLLACALVALKLAFGVLVVLPATIPPPDPGEVERVTRIVGGSCRSCAGLGVACPSGCKGRIR